MNQTSASHPSTSAQARRKGVPLLSTLHLPDWMRSILRNRKAAVGVAILLFFILVGIFADKISPTRNPAFIVAKGSQPPSVDYVLGTSREGKDIFVQVVHGTRITLVVGFLTGTVIMIIAIAVGITAGYVGGLIDEALSLIMNTFLILPGLPLIIVVAGWLDRPGPFTVVLVLSFTSWAYGARVLRSQTLALRHSEFVAAARVSGEPTWRIVLFEILPNMTSLVVSSWIGAVLYAILAEAAFEFIGLGDPNTVSWGTILYWAQNNQALLTNNWWAFIPPGICIALVGFSLTLINYGIDEITNPRLRKESELVKAAAVDEKAILVAATDAKPVEPEAKLVEGERS